MAKSLLTRSTTRTSSESQHTYALACLNTSATDQTFLTLNSSVSISSMADCAGRCSCQQSTKLSNMINNR